MFKFLVILFIIPRMPALHPPMETVVIFLSETLILSRQEVKTRRKIGIKFCFTSGELNLRGNTINCKNIMQMIAPKFFIFTLRS